MEKIIILGAGAIGRGFLPWVVNLDNYELVFIDINRWLVDLLNERGQYHTYRVKSNRLQELLVTVKKAYHLSEFNIKKYNPSCVFMNVGPRNCLSAASCLKGVNCPVILCENAPQTVEIVKDTLNYDRVYFAIPDVITSNTASPKLLAKDPLSIVTEDGILFVDERAKRLKGDIRFCNKQELENQWTAKLYLHNTPHCIAAYLGNLVGVCYVHEAMKFPQIKEIVTGAMSEMLTALKLKWSIPHSFLNWYADKELKRFSCELLCDPVSRVAREPLRKLRLKERLVGAAQICLSLGFIPKNVLMGIVSALLFENEQDSDSHLSFMYRTLSPDFLLNYILGLRKGEALELILSERLKKIAPQLEVIIKNSRGVT